MSARFHWPFRSRGRATTLTLLLLPSAACFEDAVTPSDTDTQGATSTGDGTTGATTSATGTTEASESSTSTSTTTSDAESSSSGGEGESSTGSEAEASSGAPASESSTSGEGDASSSGAAESSTGDEGSDVPCPECASGFCDRQGTCASGVFVSSVTYPGSLGGLTGADMYCDGLARAAGLRGDWMAWLSDDRLAAGQRIPGASDPYVLYDGTRVAANFDVFRTHMPGDLDAIYLEHAIDQTEYGLEPRRGTACTGFSTVIPVWTSTITDGTWDTYDTCDAWRSTDEVDEVNLGNARAIDSWWTAFACSEGDCSRTASLYCFQASLD